LQYASGGQRPPDGLDDVGIHFAGRGQAGPRIALLVCDAGQPGEPGSGRGEVGGTLPVMNRQAQGATTGGEPAYDVAIDPGKSMRSGQSVTPHVISLLSHALANSVEVSLHKLSVEASV
jgi:hypothetical protein